jgi:apolipoprotein N-acyltransferase
MTGALLAAAVVIVIAAILLRSIGWGTEVPAEARLLRICQGNRDQAERLIQGELKRNGALSRDEAADRALQRYQRDNR